MSKTDRIETVELPVRYLRQLLLFISVASLFEGYDLLIINLALPYLRADFGANSKTLGFAVGLINVGTIMAFIPVQLSDRYGRRPVFITAVTGYTICTVLSAASFDLYYFVVCQFVARLFMVSEIGVGAIILTEEMPARFRGEAITVMFAASLLGGVAGSAIFPHLVDTRLSWRALYLVSGILIPLILFYRCRLQETERWRHEHCSRRQVVLSLLSDLKALGVVFTPAYRRRAIAASCIWFAVNAWSASCLFFFAYYVTDERGWSPAQIGHTLSVGYILAAISYATAGPAMDYAGRRPTACIYFAVGGIGAIVCFLADSNLLITISYIVVLGMHALWPIAATITSEMFPTHVRGISNAVVNNLLGRTGMALAPAIVGGLSVLLGSVGKAVAIVATVTFVCIPIVLLLVSETKGRELEDIV